MNIFVLDRDPIVAAQYHCDKHVPKMVVELYQQLGSAVRRHGATDSMMPLTKAGKPLKGGYPNHPCTRWVGETRGNYLWTIDHAIALTKEFEFRFKKKHFCADGIRTLANRRMRDLVPVGLMTPFAQAMPDQYKNGMHPVEAYRFYYAQDKQFNGMSFEYKRGREEPHWLTWYTL